MKLYLRLLYKSAGFIISFLLLGTLFVYLETVLVENNFKSFVDESDILIDDYEKSYMPIIASFIISYFIVFRIPWFRKKKDYS